MQPLLTPQTPHRISPRRLQRLPADSSQGDPHGQHSRQPKQTQTKRPAFPSDHLLSLKSAGITKASAETFCLVTDAASIDILNMGVVTSISIGIPLMSW